MTKEGDLSISDYGDKMKNIAVDLSPADHLIE